MSSDPLYSCFMFWPDNEPLPEQGQIRPSDLFSTPVRIAPLVVKLCLISHGTLSTLLFLIQGTKVRSNTNRVTGFARNAAILTGGEGKFARHAIHVSVFYCSCLRRCSEGTL